LLPLFSLFKRRSFIGQKVEQFLLTRIEHPPNLVRYTTEVVPLQTDGRAMLHRTDVERFEGMQ
jgi:hypothetical protein